MDKNTIIKLSKDKKLKVLILKYIDFVEKLDIIQKRSKIIPIKLSDIIELIEKLNSHIVVLSTYIKSTYNLQDDESCQSEVCLVIQGLSEYYFNNRKLD